MCLASWHDLHDGHTFFLLGHDVCGHAFSRVGKICLGTQANCQGGKGSAASLIASIRARVRFLPVESPMTASRSGSTPVCSNQRLVASASSGWAGYGVQGSLLFQIFGDTNVPCSLTGQGVFVINSHCLKTSHEWKSESGSFI